MKQMFLASEIDVVAKHIAEKIGEVSKLKAVFIDTSGELEKGRSWEISNRDGLNKAGIKTFDYTITGKSIKDLEKDLGDCDLIHVNGGNTFYLLLQARKSGFDKFIRKQVEKGVIYTGSSAGSMVASPNIEIASKLATKVYEKELKTFDGFNLVDFITFPHWGRDDHKKQYLNRRLEVAYKPENKIILLNDNQYVWVKGKDYEIVDIRKDK